MSRTILFLCPHGAAKSVLAAAYCRQLVDEYNLDFQIDSAGTEPDSETAPAVVELLGAKGIDVTRHVPRSVTAEELAGAFRIVSLGCDVQDIAPPNAQIEHWNDIPLPSQNLTRASDMIHLYVEWLVNELKLA